MTIETVRSNSVLVHWSPPESGEFTEYSIRYRTDSEQQWVRLPSVRSTEADITDMTKGEKYTIQVNTVSFGVESPVPQEVNTTVPPNPVSNIIQLVDSRNITLEWPKPEGRVESYILKWWPSDNPGRVQTKNVSENKSGELAIDWIDDAFSNPIGNRTALSPPKNGGGGISQFSHTFSCRFSRSFPASPAHRTMCSSSHSKATESQITVVTL